MKTVKVQGGLGNQLFCLGFAHRLARITGETVALDSPPSAPTATATLSFSAPLAASLDMPLVRRPLLSSRPVTALMRGPALPTYVSDRRPPPRRLGFALGSAGDAISTATGRTRHGSTPGFRDIARDFLLEQAGHGPTPRRRHPLPDLQGRAARRSPGRPGRRLVPPLPRSARPAGRRHLRHRPHLRRSGSRPGTDRRRRPADPPRDRRLRVERHGPDATSPGAGPDQLHLLLVGRLVRRRRRRSCTRRRASCSTTRPRRAGSPWWIRGKSAPRTFFGEGNGPQNVSARTSLTWGRARIFADQRLAGGLVDADQGDGVVARGRRGRG